VNPPSSRFFARLHCFVTAVTALVVTIALASCYRNPGSVLERMSNARQIAARLQVEFTQASDATNLAVMADTNEASAQFARETEQKMLAVQRDAEALRPLLASLMFSGEKDLLDRFEQQLATYRTLDRNILELAVASTNLKAQRLSFGPAQQAADDFRVALEVVAQGVSENSCQVQALCFRALASLRQIQALQAPHIASPLDDVMTRLEQEMTAAEADARSALQSLAALTRADTKTKVAAAEATLDRFVQCNQQIIALSRRNSNVRALALALGQKRNLAALCEDSLRELNESIAQRGFSATR